MNPSCGSVPGLTAIVDHHAIDFVVAHAGTRAQQEACVAALISKCEILWAMLDGIAAAYPPDGATRG